MGLWDDVKGGWDYVSGGWTEDFSPLGPGRDENEYAGVARANYDLPGYQQQQDRIDSFYNRAGGQAAPQIGAYQNAQNSGFRGQQSDLAGMLMGAARGQNSVSREQLRQAADSNISQQQALAATGRGNPALAQLAASQNAGRINQGLAGQQALAGLQERQMAMGQLGNVLAQGRGADEQIGMFNAGQQNQRTGQQAAMNQQQFGMNNQAQLGAMGLGLNASGMQQQGGMGYEGQRGQRFMGMLGVPTSQEELAGGIMGLAQSFGGG